MIFEDHRQYLGFSWQNNSNATFWFINGGVHFQQSVARPVNYLRSKGARLLTFLEDGIGVGASFQEACDISILIKLSFKILGFCLQIKSANGVQVKREFG